jgi:hypothetical protein
MLTLGLLAGIVVWAAGCDELEEVTINLGGLGRAASYLYGGGGCYDCGGGYYVDEYYYEDAYYYEDEYYYADDYYIEDDSWYDLGFDFDVRW